MGNPFLTPRSTSALVNAIPDKDMPWGTRILHLVSLVFLAGEGGGGRGGRKALFPPLSGAGAHFPSSGW